MRKYAKTRNTNKPIKFDRLFILYVHSCFYDRREREFAMNSFISFLSGEKFVFIKSPPMVVS